ncbi:MAG: hypothetical protein INR62_06215, partial [Rhodospirillales bacterium]|nr:hypothetical protein [Acetobacter sp.]
MARFGRQHLTALLVSLLFCTMQGTGQNSPTGASSSPLQVTFGANGLQTLAYNGTVLADVTAHTGDAFYIGHMKATDAHGSPLSGGQYGWGEANNGRHFDLSTRTWTYTFTWGTISVEYRPSATQLDVLTAVTNNSNSGINFDGAAVFPLVLHFPQLPAGFGAPNYPQMAFNTTGPSVTVADWGGGEVVAVVPDAGKPLYSGFWPAQSSGGVPYAPEISGTTPDGLATF